MRDYEVKYYIDDAEMVRGEKPHSEIYESEIVEASSSQEAIDLVIDFLIDQAIQNGESSPERDGDRINFMDTEGEIVVQYYNFSVDSPIKAARMEAGLSRAEMSRQFRIPIRTLEDWEAGKHDPAPWAEMLVVDKLDRTEYFNTLRTVRKTLEGCGDLEEAIQKIDDLLEGSYGA